MKDDLFRPAARAGINGIWDYTAERWDADQADTITRQIADACKRLAAGTSTGRSIEDIRPGYHEYLAGPHVIYYRESSFELEIVRVLHQHMDAARHLS